MDCWSILGIQKTQNKQHISSAFEVFVNSHEAKEHEQIQTLRRAQALALQYADFTSTETQFSALLDKVLSEPVKRHNNEYWAPVLSALHQLESIEIDRTRAYVFTMFINHFDDKDVAIEGRLVPQDIVQQFSETYNWEFNRPSLSQFFVEEKIEVVLNYSVISSPSSLNKRDSLQPIFSKRTLFLNIGLGLFIFGVYWMYKQSNEPPPSIEAPAPISFDTNLLACNKVISAEPTENFNTCLEFAKNGNMAAQKRMVWAYSRAGDYLDWQEVFNWLKVTQRYEQKAKILSFAVMHFMGNTPELKEMGERGLTRLVNQNQANANVVLGTMYALNTNVLPQSSNPLWLFERAYIKDPDVLAPIDLSTIFANGYLSKPQPEKAKSILQDTAEKYFPNGTNNVAWFLSTLDQNPIADPSFAIGLAKQVVEDPKYATTHTYVDTLAATYAANGQFDLAIATQQEAIGHVKNLEISDENKEKIMGEFTARLTMYKEQIKVVETTLHKDKTVFFETLQKHTLNRLLNSFYQNITAPKPELKPEQ